MRHLDGRHLRRAVVAGADWVRHTREHLNRINVFPVADGDTGTNMALSLSATASAVRHGEGRDLAEVADQVAEASVLHAKGNSGLILAHWFLGLSRAVNKRARLTGAELAKAMHSATEHVYEAIEEPVEGTILTVMRAASDAAKRAASRSEDIVSMIETILEEAEQTLGRTPEMLQVLREAHVVDAGAQGWVNFLRGVRRELRGEPPPPIPEESVREGVHHPAASGGDLRHRFCTELVVRGKRFQPELLRARFHSLGSSLLVATTGEVFKLHIHTNHPDRVLQAAARLGTIEERKVDDMRQQQEERGRQQRPVIPLAEQPSTVAVLCDTTSDIPEDVCSELGIERVPLQVLFGDEVFRDQVDLTTPQFYERLFQGEILPSTSQPPPRAFVEALERVRQDREVIVCTLSSALSGTYRSALSGIALAKQPRIEVFDTGSASMGEGLVAMNAARLAARGAGCEEILTWMRRWADDTRLLFSVSTLKYLRRGGRIGLAKGVIGGLLGVRPILTFRDGTIQPLAQTRGDDAAYEKLMGLLDEELTPGARVRIGLVESTPCPQLDEARQRLEARYDVLELVRAPVTGVVGAHAGPGAWGIFHQTVRPDDPLIA